MINKFNNNFLKKYAIYEPFQVFHHSWNQQVIPVPVPVPVPGFSMTLSAGLSAKDEFTYTDMDDNGRYLLTREKVYVRICKYNIQNTEYILYGTIVLPKRRIQRALFIANKIMLCYSKESMFREIRFVFYINLFFGA